MKLTPKPRQFSSENQRPITCLNNMYKWFTSGLKPMDQHLDHHELMEGQQRGAKTGCSGTMDNLLIDRMVTLDCHRGKRNLSMACGSSGATTDLQTVRRTGAPGPRGPSKPQTINKLHGSSQYNKQLLSANCLFLLMVLLSIIFSLK